MDKNCTDPQRVRFPGKDGRTLSIVQNVGMATMWSSGKGDCPCAEIAVLSDQGFDSAELARLCEGVTSVCPTTGQIALVDVKELAKVLERWTIE